MNCKVVAIGEVLWDVFPDRRELGGATANFAYHTAALGARSALITRVGNDSSGVDILRRCKAMGLDGGTIQVDEVAPTGTVSVEITGSGIPEFTIHENVAWDRISVDRAGRAAVLEADAICFGSLAQRGEVSRQTIQALVAAAPCEAWKIFDVNLRQSLYSRTIIEKSLELANVLKLNEAELPVLSEMLGFGGAAMEVIENLSARYELDVVAFTRGSEGSLIYKGGCWSERGVSRVEVVDTVGAGDAFTAGLCVGLLQGMELDVIHTAASRVAAYVCSRPGGTPELPSSLRDLFR